MTDAPLAAGTPTALATCLLADDHRLLLLRRAFSQRVDPGAWTTALHAHPSPGEQPEDAVRRRALRVLGLRLDEVRTVLPAPPVAQAPTAPGPPAAASPVLVARVRRRVVVPDPTEFDEAEWVEWPELVGSVRAGTLRLATWCAEQVEQLDALGLPGAAWARLGAPSHSARPAG